MISSTDLSDKSFIPSKVKLSRILSLSFKEINLADVVERNTFALAVPKISSLSLNKINETLKINSYKSSF